MVGQVEARSRERELCFKVFLKPTLTYDPAILLIGVYPKECKSGYNKGTEVHHLK
jgi:hypothetical protein